MKDPDDMDGIEYGLYLGYPLCCVQSFDADMMLRRWMTRGKRKLAGTGYIPCAVCNDTKTEEELKDAINANRQHSIPFPDRSI